MTRQYAALFDFAPLGYFLVDADGRICQANLAGAALLGCEREGLLGTRLQAFLDESNRIGFTELMTGLFTGETTRSTELHLQGGERGARTVVVTGSLAQEGGQCFLVMLDVTEQHRMEEEVRAAHERYRRIVETTSEGVVITDASARFSYVNERFAQMLGYASEAIVGRSAFDFMEREDHKLGDERLERRRRGTAEGYEARLKHKDGHHVWIRVASNPLLDAQGLYEGTLAVISDITEQRLAEALLRDTQAQLQQSQKLEALGSLAGGVAHDFNNLLSVILAYTGLMLEDAAAGAPPPVALTQIFKAAQKAGLLTKQLLAFSRKQVLQPENLDLNQSVAGLEGMLARLLGPQLRISVIAEPGLGRCRADPGQIEQLLVNLAVNARDAMPGGGALTIQTRNVRLDAAHVAKHGDVAPGPYVMLSVQDTGSGIDPSVLGRIFEPFFTTKEVGSGTGLGLAMVYGIVKQSGGHIEVDSVLGVGTTFRVYLPRTELTGARTHASEPSPATWRVKDQGTETILLVDDEEAVRGSTAAILRKQGYQVLEAASPGDALIIFEQHGATIALLLADVAMPHMNGRQLAQRLVPTRPGLKVLYISGHPRHVGLEDAFHDTSVAYLQKPFLPSELGRVVRALLDAP